jgi:RHS repeat-associated protein
MFVWCRDGFRRFQPCEARNAAGSVTALYFSRGESISGSSYFYTSDALANPPNFAQRFSQSRIAKQKKLIFNPTFTGSILEMTNNSGAIVDQRTYDMYGRVTRLQGSVSSDFQFGAYYTHSPSGLNLTLRRPYTPSLGRFISRDPLQEDAGLNLYRYMDNHPESGIDPSGKCIVAAPWVVALIDALLEIGIDVGTRRFPAFRRRWL